ncbi:T9SS type A sorting domain-containing protein [candidate division WOR-3 bacterium]|nr:T9SS type A sorting domain-containing protein [candidate division WOR-3 bacterium]
MNSWPPPDSWYNKHYGDIRYGGMWAPHYRYDYYGFLKFSLDSLPDSCTIVQAELEYYQYDSYGPQVDVGLIRDPVPLYPSDLLAEIRDAPAIIHGRASSDGWMMLPFDTPSFPLLDSCLRSGWGSFGLRSVGNHWGFAYGYDSDSPPFLRVEYAMPNGSDIHALHAEFGTYPLVAQGSDTALLTLTNNGFGASGLFWTYATAPGLGVESTLVGNISVGETMSLALRLPSPSRADTLVTYRLYDELRGDDRTQLTCWAFPANTCSAEGFEDPTFPPTGWVTRGSGLWQRSGPLPVGAHSGEYVATDSGHNCWLITNGIVPEPGVADTFGIFFSVPDSWCEAQVWALGSQDPVDTLTRLFADTIREGSWCEVRIGLDQFDGHAVYLGFRSAAGTAAVLCMDDIWFTSAHQLDADIRALHAEMKTYPLVAGGSDTALLSMVNRGPLASGPFWAYASLGTMRESTLVGPIAAGETTSASIRIPSPLMQDTMLDYFVWATAIRHDAAQLQCWSFPAKTCAAEGFDGSLFPPPGWLVTDNDSGTQSWTRQSGPGTSHSGAGSASCVADSTGVSDDWLTSSAVCPSRDNSDSVGFYFRSGANWQIDNLEVLALSTRLSPIRLWWSGIPDTTYSRHSVSLDTCDGDTIKVVFRHWSPGGGVGICLDDIWFSHAYTPSRDTVQRTNTKLPTLAFVPNPSGRGVVTVSSFLAVGRRRSLAIRNVVGRIIHRSVLDPSGVTRLDLRGLHAGVYMATLEAGTQSLTRKLVITGR